jgi:ankyrin repeat protein
LEISLKSDSSVSDLWNLFLSLLPSNESQLHAIVDLACPLLVTRRALLEFPFQVSQRDDQGRTALHIAAATNTSNVIIAELVQHFPPAARMTDAEGRLPIDIAAEYGKDSDVVEALIKAEPRALDTRDLRDKRYPFVSAAMGDHENTVATTYYLLRAKPHVISYFHLD